MLCFCVASVFAETNPLGSKVSLKLKDKPVSAVFDAIKAQTSYSFWYDVDDVDVERLVTVNAKNETVKTILSNVLKGQNVDFAFLNNHIVIARRGTLEVTQQSKLIKGTVTDAKGEPVIGANVVEKGTSNGIITDVDGNFSLNVGNNATLIISYIGYVTQEIAVGSRTDLNITLLEDSKALDEVVVTALGIKREQKALAYSTQTVKSDALTAVKGAEVATSL
ncbi:MAG: carboxypeptidase-like regulatory domain-containing protein, partial [Tannerella sp.]|nr:carboxypeptidase-like regulatory domain-containing protein [Tannerella sp.]